jgi:enoyl-CoA hydratase/carnithine racemase
MPAPNEDIQVTIDEAGIALVTLNRPAKRNAVTLAMWRELRDLFSGFAERRDIRAVILTGAGGNFCAGADISEFPTVRANAEMGRVYEEAADGATLAIRDCPRPTIAAISGYAMGGGCGVALACDFRIGDASAKMGIPAARLGIVYGALDCSLLYRQVGLANAKRVLYSARAFGVEDCANMRLLDQVTSGNALEAARDLAAEFAGNAPLTLQGSKFILEALAAGTADQRSAEIHGVIDQAMNSADYREGARAFIEKRRPAFQGV